MQQARQHQPQLNKSIQNKGFAHLILLLVVVVLVIGVIAFFAVGKNSFNLSTLNPYSDSPSPTAAPVQSLEEEANAIPEEDPEEDFSEIDEDISNL